MKKEGKEGVREKGLGVEISNRQRDDAREKEREKLHFPRAVEKKGKRTDVLKNRTEGKKNKKITMQKKRMTSEGLAAGKRKGKRGGLNQGRISEGKSCASTRVTTHGNGIGLSITMQKGFVF